MPVNTLWCVCVVTRARWTRVRGKQSSSRVF